MSDADQAFGPHSDLTYRVIEDLNLDGNDLRQCLFTGAVFRRASFRGVNFRRSDFDAARFENCTFDRCDLSIDMRSTLFAGSVFRACTVGTAFITDCTFDNCIFDAIHFDDCAISHNAFRGCLFDKTSLTQSTFVHNTVRTSKLTHTNMGDCTFLYVIMTECVFIECTMNLESIGMIYGLAPADIRCFRYVHLGVEQDMPSPDIFLETLLGQYISRRWRIGVAVLRLSFHLASCLYTFHHYLADTQETFASGTPLNREELLFVAKLMSELFGERRLPLATCFEVRGWCSAAAEFARESHPGDADRTTEALRELSNRALALSQEGLQVIEASNAGAVLAVGVDRPIAAKVVFVTKPSVDVALLMTTIATDTGLVISNPSHRTQSHTGSWAEYFETTILSLAALRVFLYFINGVLYDVAEARARLNVLTRSRLPKEIVDLALRPQAPLSASLVAPLKAIASEALRSTWMNDPQLSGLDASNVKTVQAIDSRGSGTSAEVPQ